MAWKVFDRVKTAIKKGLRMAWEILDYATDGDNWTNIDYPSSDYQVLENFDTPNWLATALSRGWTASAGIDAEQVSGISTLFTEQSGERFALSVSKDVGEVDPFFEYNSADNSGVTWDLITGSDGVLHLFVRYDGGGSFNFGYLQVRVGHSADHCGYWTNLYNNSEGSGQPDHIGPGFNEVVMILNSPEYVVGDYSTVDLTAIDYLRIEIVAFNGVSGSFDDVIIDDLHVK